jgi:hypothetical protein
VTRWSYSARLVAAAVAAKAALMGVLVSILASSAPFAEAVVLVLISAAATGVFGIVIVLVQTHAEAAMHRRLDKLEEQAGTAAQAATVAAEKTQQIVEAVTPNGANGASS